jgi:hypothetical protein
MLNHLKILNLIAGLTLLPTIWACGNRSTVQKDSGSCEETGRVLVPANPETGRKAYCSAATSEQICNLRDQKLDRETNECVPVTDDDVRMLYLNDQPSALNRLDQDVLSICLGGDTYSQLSEDSKFSLKQKLLQGATIWLTPLLELGLPSFENRIAFVEPGESCPDRPLARVMVVNDTFSTCKINRRACVLYENATIYFRIDGLTDEVIVHEFGHIFGMADLYVDPEQRPDDPADFVTGCLKGFFGSTMCHERLDLGPADLAGIKNMYCAIKGHGKCKRPKSWQTAYFGAELTTCSSVDEEESFLFQLKYDRKRALLNQAPYSGKVIEDYETGSEEIAVDVDGDLDPNGTQSKIELRDTNTGMSRYTWDVKESKLSDKPMNCQVNPWFTKA